MTSQFLYIGPYSPGETCRMRGERLKELLPDWDFQVVDTRISQHESSHWSVSLGWRYHIGPFISKLNRFVLNSLTQSKYEIIWVDKGIMLTPRTIEELRKRAKVLVHFTPDPAFLYHRSRFFFKSMALYDFLITTKSYEIEQYHSAVSARTRVLYATQGYEEAIHHPYENASEKQSMVFIGHHETEREKILQYLLDHQVPVKLAGINWEDFCRRNERGTLTFLGERVVADAYGQAISGARYSWGALSRWVPEKHTTRTFEIPACGTALITEHNEEIDQFFREDEAIFYRTPEEMLEKIRYYDTHLDELAELTVRGQQRVINDGRSYRAILQRLLSEIMTKLPQ